MSTGPPEYESGIKEILKRCSPDTLDMLINNANELVK